MQQYQSVLVHPQHSIHVASRDSLLDGLGELVDLSLAPEHRDELEVGVHRSGRRPGVVPR